MTGDQPQSRWMDLEHRIEQFLASQGYSTRRNAVITGRSGANHEVDVLGVRGDAVTDYRLAVECKAWNRPVEKDAVAKLAYVVDDVGAHKGILVALRGGQLGATQAARQLGIDLWGPAELEERLGGAAVAALHAGPAAVLGSGVAMRCPAAEAERLVARERHAGFGAAREQIAWVRPTWVAQHLVALSITTEERRFLGRSATRATWRWNLYEAVLGSRWRTLDGPPPLTPVDLSVHIPPAMSVSTITSAIGKAARRRREVSTGAARERWCAELESLGVPTEASSVAVEHSEVVYWPFHLGLLTKGPAARVVAVDGVSGVVSPPVSVSLTAAISHVLRSWEEPAAG